MRANALLDKTFLKKLDQQTQRIIYARVVVLDWNEYPVAEVSGMMTAGSVNVDGSSIVRRSCSITMVTSSIEVNNIDWAIRTKYKFFIGVQNNIDENYDDIIWFPQGIFVLTSYSSTLNTSGYQISLSGKDKMCLLNGDLGGNLFASHDFGKEWLLKRDGTYEEKDLLIKDIIKEAVHTYAQEQYSNIIIEDLDACGVELLDYLGDSPLYIIKMTAKTTGLVSFQLAKGDEAAIYEAKYNAGTLTWDDNVATYTIEKRCEYGDTAGFRPTDLTYTGDLIIEINGTITSMLDKIVQMLGEFEYFYDVYGRFIFHRKPIYFNTSWSNVKQVENETYYDAIALSSEFSYEFDTSFLVESFQNKPDLNKIKNDWSVWGQKTNSSGESSPIHIRYAIDTKPEYYYSLKRKTGYWASNSSVDWRELIYLMAEDNAQAHDRIAALKLALEQGFYELNPYEISDNYMDLSYTGTNDLYKWTNVCYWYDAVRNKFYRMDRKTDDLSQFNYDAVLGQNRLMTYLKLKNPIWVKDPTLSYYVLNDTQVAALRAEAERWLNDPNNTAIVALNQQVEQAKTAFENYRDTYEQQVNALIARYGQEHSSDYSVAQLQIEINTFNIQYEATKDELYEKYLEALAAKPTVADLLDGKYDQYIAVNVNPDDNPVDMELYEKVSELEYTLTYDYMPINGKTYYRKQFALGDAQNAAAKKLAIYNAQQKMQLEIQSWEATFNTGYDAYYSDMLAFWPRLYRIDREINYEYNDDGTITRDAEGKVVENSVMSTEVQADGTFAVVQIEAMSPQVWIQWQNNSFWNPDLVKAQRIKIEGTNNYLINTQIEFKDPESLYFWIDFVDDKSELQEFLPALIGRRPRAVKDDKIGSLYYKSTPSILLLEPWKEIDEQVQGYESLGYHHVQLGRNDASYFRISSQGKSAKDEVDSMIFDNTYYNDTITLSCVPIYYLEPNTRIFVQDKNSGICGEYFVKSFNYSLAHDGMMSITANKAGERIL